jgi:hypothetical protein
MALIPCPECKKKISDNADSCPNCGYQLTPEKVAEIKTKRQQAQKFRGIGCLAVILIFVILYMIGSFSSDSQKSDEIWHRKYVLVKAMDETTFKMGVFDKIEIGTPDRVEITLNMRDRIASGVALDLMPKFKEVGFKVLRLKHKGSDRYEDHKIE